ncbi:MAG TPA: GyrI-like domain-containing protein [bacterium]|nr:GyrI-like domain-containing protein [bacterium]
MIKYDFKQSHKDLYKARAGKIVEVTGDAGVYLAVDGKGEPGGAAFSLAIQKIYSVAFTAKFALKAQGVVDFVVNPLETLWLVDDPQSTPLAEWGWTLLVRIPETVTSAHLTAIKKEINRKNGLDTAEVKRRKWKEGRAMQTLHVGPYDKLGESYAKIAAHAQERGWTPQGPAHEVYLSDPRRTKPENLKTIVRLPIVKAK